MVIGFLLYALFCAFLLDAQPDTHRQALVKVSLADTASKPLATYKGMSVAAQYNNFPWAPDKGFSSCPRMHQLKFNEVVTITSDPALDEVECTAFNFYYRDNRNKQQRTFWTLKKNLILLSDLKKRVPLPHIPPPVSMYKAPADYNKDVLTLIEPWYYEKTKKWYAAGTRFARYRNEDTQETYAVYLIDTDRLKQERVSIPKSRALVSYPRGKQNTVALFLRLLRRWAHPGKGIIPYVYGGCGYMKRYKDGGFSRAHGRKRGYQVAFWQRTGIGERPCAGFDCSELILCAAQICGMPYYCKNTRTLMERLRPLAKGEALEEGDLVWYEGHVMIVSDLKKNLLIEAVGYEVGYGKVHEIEVKRVIRGIRNFNGLVRAHHTRHSLMRLDSKGRPSRRIRRLKILKLKSLWARNR